MHEMNSFLGKRFFHLNSRENEKITSISFFTGLYGDGLEG